MIDEVVAYILSKINVEYIIKHDQGTGTHERIHSRQRAIP